MIHITHQTLFYFHVVLGSCALIAFWLPLATTKGSKQHILSGKVFAWSMYTVSVTGVIMTLMALAFPFEVYAVDTSLAADRQARILANIRSMNSFLFMLSLLVFCTTHHALMVVKYKQNRDGLKSLQYLTPVLLLAAMGITLIVLGSIQGNTLYLVFGGISTWASAGMLMYVYKSKVAVNAWLIEHFSGLIGSGIGAYTAFFAFGGRRFMGDILNGQLQLIPWILPTVIGLIGTAYLTRKYRVKKTSIKSAHTLKETSA